jgi:chemosensory pili system protein ChpE
MELFATSFVLGIVYCAPPGIVTVEAVRRGMVRGFWGTLLVELGSLIGDATWAILALTGLAFLIEIPVVGLILGGIGVLFLFYLAWTAIRDGIRKKMPETSVSSSKSDFATGAFLSLGNPFTLAFWLGIGATTLSTTAPDQGWTRFVIFFSAFMLGALLWCFILAFLVLWGRKLLKPEFFRWVNLACGIFLAYFGIGLLRKIIQISL